MEIQLKWVFEAVLIENMGIAFGKLAYWVVTLDISIITRHSPREKFHEFHFWWMDFFPIAYILKLLKSAVSIKYEALNFSYVLNSRMSNFLWNENRKYNIWPMICSNVKPFEMEWRHKTVFLLENVLFLLYFWLPWMKNSILLSSNRIFKKFSTLVTSPDSKMFRMLQKATEKKQLVTVWMWVDV